MTIVAEKPEMSSDVGTLQQLPTRLHHNAYVCSSQERTRHFYEDIIGLPLVASWIEQSEFPDFPGRKVSFIHTFFGIGDGGALAFFEFSDADVAAKFKANQQPFFVHIALAASAATRLPLPEQGRPLSTRLLLYDFVAVRFPPRPDRGRTPQAARRVLPT